MPYKIERKGSRYQVVNTDTGKSHGLTTRAKAEKQLKLLQAIEHDWTPTGDGGYTRTINGRRVKMRVK